MTASTRDARKGDLLLVAGARLMTIHLIRSITESVSEYYYDLKTDVWVFGDCEGYGEFIAQLHRASAARDPIHLTAIPDDSPGMVGVLLPASAHPTGKPALKLVERIVFCRGAPKMQLVLYGNQEGYLKLAGLARQAMVTQLGPVEHWHCDDASEDWIVKRSISLNLRGAVGGWSADALGEYFDDVRTGGEHRLPTDVSWLAPDESYSYDVFPDDICESAPYRLRPGASRKE